MNELSRRGVEAPMPVATFGRAGRLDRQTEYQARVDYQNARLAQHRAELEAVVERTRARLRADLTMQAMTNVRQVNDYAITIAAGREALGMVLAEMQQAYFAGEVARIISRGYDG